MMSDYIKREDAIGIVKNLKRFSCFGDDGFVEIPMVYCELMQVASADVAPVRHGRWIDKGDGAECSICGSFWKYAGAWDKNGIARVFKYCETCGTRMDGDDNEID